MMTRSASLVLALLVAGAGPAPVKIAWNLKNGDLFFVEETTSAWQTLKTGRNETRLQLDQTKLIRFTVLSVSNEGFVLAKKIERTTVSATGGDEPTPDTKALRALEGAEFQVSVGRTGTVEKIVGHNQLVQRVAREDATTAHFLRTLLTEDSFKAGTEALFQFVPDGDVAKGDRWQRMSRASLGSLGSLSCKNTYTLLGEDEKNKDLLKISVAFSRSYHLPEKKGASPFSITKALIRSDEAGGTLWFHPKSGRLVRAESRQTLKGSLTLSTASGPVEMDVSHQQSTKVRVLEKAPLERKK